MIRLVYRRAPLQGPVPLKESVFMSFELATARNSSLGTTKKATNMLNMNKLGLDNQTNGSIWYRMRKRLVWKSTHCSITTIMGITITHPITIQLLRQLSKRLWYHNVPLPCYSSFADNDIRCNATAQVLTSDFFSHRMVIDRGASVDVNVIEQEQVHGHLFPITSDKNVSTCVNTTLGHKQLQAIFTFPSLPPNDQLSVEVILMNVDDCSSPAWTWFVESECRPVVYTECSSTHITRVAEFTHCGIHCVCLDSCDFLYFKYSRVPLRTQRMEQLCEIWSPRNGRNWLCLHNLQTRMMRLTQWRLKQVIVILKAVFSRSFSSFSWMKFTVLCILISLKFAPKCPIENKSVLVR